MDANFAKKKKSKFQLYCISRADQSWVYGSY